MALLKLGMLFRLFGESKRNKDRNDFCFLIQSDMLPKIPGQTKSKSPRKIFGEVRVRPPHLESVNERRFPEIHLTHLLRRQRPAQKWSPSRFPCARHVIAEKGIFVREEDFFWFLYDTECGMLGVDLEGFHTSAVCVQRFGN